VTFEEILKELIPPIETGLVTRILLDSIITLIMAVVIVKAVSYITTRMARRNIITQSVADRINRITSLTLYSLALVLILFFVTGAKEIIYLIMVLAIVFMIYSWYPMINVMSYYAIMLSRHISVGDPVEVGGFFVKVRDITKLSTIIKTSSGDVVSIPNYRILVEVIRRRAESRQASLLVLVRNYGDASKLDELEKKIRNIIVTRFRQGLRMMEPSINLVRLSRNEACFMVSIALVGYEARLRPLSELAKLLALSLDEYDVEVRVPEELVRPANLFFQP
jgi:small-conductance mechanosensitive channel